MANKFNNKRSKLQPMLYYGVQPPCGKPKENINLDENL